MMNEKRVEFIARSFAEIAPRLAPEPGTISTFSTYGMATFVAGIFVTANEIVTLPGSSIVVSIA